MGNMTLFIIGIALLSAGTYLMRLGGAKLGSRLALSERSQALLSDAATVLLFSVALATTFYEGEHFCRNGARSWGWLRRIFSLA
ncbi:Inner membrane protein [Salmonella enterica subsp. enterica]|uniref:Inner membrane protein n=1 Tax=Salmonella enterica I TaxID=59201 RepID=A0A3S4JHD7_SALET|nr:Inner membrane protein [Salmonella enterica subsp. enterica]